MVSTDLQSSLVFNEFLTKLQGWLSDCLNNYYSLEESSEKKIKIIVLLKILILKYTTEISHLNLETELDQLFDIFSDDEEIIKRLSAIRSFKEYNSKHK